MNETSQLGCRVLCLSVEISQSIGMFLDDRPLVAQFRNAGV